MDANTGISLISDALGLSTATVSKVIHGKTEKISDETVKRVQQELENGELLMRLPVEWLIEEYQMNLFVTAFQVCKNVEDAKDVVQGFRGWICDVIAECSFT